MHGADFRARFQAITAMRLLAVVVASLVAWVAAVPPVRTGGVDVAGGRGGDRGPHLHRDVSEDPRGEDQGQSNGVSRLSPAATASQPTGGGVRCPTTSSSSIQVEWDAVELTDLYYIALFETPTSRPFAIRCVDRSSSSLLNCVPVCVVSIHTAVSGHGSSLHEPSFRITFRTWGARVRCTGGWAYHILRVCVRVRVRVYLFWVGEYPHSS